MLPLHSSSIDHTKPPPVQLWLRTAAAAYHTILVVTVLGSSSLDADVLAIPQLQVLARPYAVARTASFFTFALTQFPPAPHVRTRYGLPRRAASGSPAASAIGLTLRYTCTYAGAARLFRNTTGAADNTVLQHTRIASGQQAYVTFATAPLRGLL